MASLYDSASLVMIPSGYKDDKLYSIKPTDGSGDFTFSRDGSGASPATRVNASGLIEKGRENVLLQSNQFDTTWVTSVASVTGGQADKDGGSTAWLLSKTASFGRVEQSITLAGVYSFSVYAKAGTSNWIAIGANASLVTSGAFFDLGTGAVGSKGSNVVYSKITALSGGWYRCEAVINNPTENYFRIYVAGANGDVIGISGNIYIQDAQLEQGLVATDYIETTTAPVSAGLLGDMPRLDYSGGATCPSLLLEPSRVNLLGHSEYFGAWVNNGASIIDNSITSPEGKQNASTITGASGNNRIYLLENTTSGTTYTLSFYAKKGTSSTIALDFINVSSGPTFNFIDKTWGTSPAWDSFGYEELSDGWFRLWGVIQSNSTNAGMGLSVDPSQTAYIFGAQVEAGSYPTSYIPTYGSASTRGKDSSSVTGVSSLIGSTEGTIYLEVSALANDLSERRFALSNGTTGNVARVGFTNVDNRILAVLYNGANQCVLTYQGADITQTNKIAFTYAANDFALYVNGESRSTDTSGTTFSANTLTEVHFNEGDGNGNESYGKFDQVLVFPTRLTNAELAALTTI